MNIKLVIHRTVDSTELSAQMLGFILKYEKQYLTPQGICGNSILSAQFCCELKLFLKIKYIKKKSGLPWWRSG